jgi:hypothetical protein
MVFNRSFGPCQAAPAAPAARPAANQRFFRCQEGTYSVLGGAIGVGIYHRSLELLGAPATSTDTAYLNP